MLLINIKQLSVQIFCTRKNKNTKKVDKTNVFVRDLLKAVLERFQRITWCQLNR